MRRHMPALVYIIMIPYGIIPIGSASRQFSKIRSRKFILGHKKRGAAQAVPRFFITLKTALFPMEVVFHADDVVFAGVFAHLDFNDYKRELAFVLQAVHLTHRDVGRFIRAHIEHLVTHGTCLSPAHDDPMLGTEHIPLPYSAAG